MVDQISGYHTRYESKKPKFKQWSLIGYNPADCSKTNTENCFGRMNVQPEEKWLDDCSRTQYDSNFVANDRDAQMSNGRNIPMYNNKNYHPEAQRAESEMVLVTTKHGRYHMGLQSLTCIEYFETSGRTTGLRRTVNLAVTQTRLCLSRGIPD